MLKNYNENSRHTVHQSVQCKLYYLLSVTVKRETCVYVSFMFLVVFV